MGRFLHKNLSLTSQKYGSWIQDPRSEFRDPRFGVQDPEKKLFWILDPGSRVKNAPDPRFRIRIRNTARCTEMFGPHVFFLKFFLFSPPIGDVSIPLFAMKSAPKQLFGVVSSACIFYWPLSCTAMKNSDRK
jgi:hypothetical protein